MRHDNPFGTRGAVQERTCARCHGFLVPSYSDSLLIETTEESSAPAWRCVNCGEWVDATVIANRTAGRSNQTIHNRLIPFSQRRWR